jgi:hypothetical protein
MMRKSLHYTRSTMLIARIIEARAWMAARARTDAIRCGRGASAVRPERRCRPGFEGAQQAVSTE